MRLAKPPRLVFGVIVIALICSWSLAALTPVFAWQTGSVKFLKDIPKDIITPKIAGSKEFFHVIFGGFFDEKLSYSRGTMAANGTIAWESPRVIATGVNRRWGWNIEADSTGTVHVIYGTTSKRILYIKNPQQGRLGNWSSPETVASPSSQANEMDIALDNQNTPYIAWGQGVDPSSLNFGYRQPGGNWSIHDTGDSANIYSNPALVVQGGGDSARVHIMVQRKRNSSADFAISYATGGRDADLKASDFSGTYNVANLAKQPTLAIDPSDNSLYTGFFNGKGLSFDFNFSYSSNGGASWSPLVRDNLGGGFAVTEKSPIVADNGTAYVLLQAKKVDSGGFTGSGFYDVRFNQVTKRFTEPVAVRDVQGSDSRNGQPDYDFNALGKAAIWVTGFTENIAYNSELGGSIVDPNRPTPVPPSPTPGTAVGLGAVKINTGAEVTSNPNVTVTLEGVTGQPTSMKVAIDGASIESAPTQPYSTTFSRVLPASNTCVRSIAVQLLNQQGLLSPVVQDTIKVDTAVQANTVVGNPYKRTNALVFSSIAAGSQIVNDGASQYTRVPNFYLEVNGSGECSSLKEVRVGRTAANLNGALGIIDNFFASPLGIPGVAAIGPNNIVVQVSDIVGNTSTYSRTIYYDPIVPVLSTTGTLQVTVPTTGTNILARLDFNDSIVTDTMYLDTSRSRQFWGVLLANSRTPITDLLKDTTLNWSAVEAGGSGNNFSLSNWSLLSGIAVAQQLPGDYYVYARFLDGAGNATTGVLSDTVTLSQINRPSTKLPYVVRP